MKTPKTLDQNLTPKKSHAEFPSHKNFQKALNGRTPKKSLLKSSYVKHVKNTCQNFPTQKKIPIENFNPQNILRSSLSLKIRSIPFPPRAKRTSDEEIFDKLL